MARFGFKPNGKPDRRSFYGATADEARTKMRAALVDRDRGVIAPIVGITVQQHLEAWLRNSVKPAVAPSTLDQYWQQIRKYIAPCDPDGRPLLLPALGRLPLVKLQPDHVRAWQANLLNQRLQRRACGDPDRCLSPRTATIALKVLRMALNAALADGLVGRNVAKLVKPPKASHAEIHPLDPAEAKRFLQAAAGERLESLYALTLRLGLRMGEVLGVRWGDVNLDAGTLTINQTLKRAGRIDGHTKLVLSDPKTASSRRSPALPASATASLRAHRARQAQERLFAGPEWDSSFDLVFTNKIGRPIDPRDVFYDFKRLLAKAQLRDIRFHDLRHSAASLLLNEGTPLKMIQELLGHSSIAITANLYAHVSSATMRAVADTMDEILAR
jgi:integrase